MLGRERQEETPCKQTCTIFNTCLVRSFLINTTTSLHLFLIEPHNNISSVYFELNLMRLVHPTLVHTCTFDSTSQSQSSVLNLVFGILPKQVKTCCCDAPQVTLLLFTLSLTRWNISISVCSHLQPIPSELCANSSSPILSLHLSCTSTVHGVVKISVLYSEIVINCPSTLLLYCTLWTHFNQHYYRGRNVYIGEAYAILCICIPGDGL